MQSGRLPDRVPFFRILVPFIAGILISSSVLCPLFWWISMGGLCLLLYCAVNLKCFILSPYTPFFNAISLGGLFLVLGAISYQEANLSSRSGSDTLFYSTAFKAEIRSEAIPKPNSTLYEAVVYEYADSLHQIATTHEPIRLYFAKNDSCAQFQWGESIWCLSRLDSIKNSGNPEEFDYAGYLQQKGIRYSAFIAPASWKKSTTTTTREWTLKEKALSIRHILLNRLIQLDLPPSQQAILSAVLLGYTQSLDREQREAFSSAGVAHILAVSGLHTGIILSLCLFIFYPLGYWASLRKFRYIPIIGLIWVYAFVTGLSPSVVRAATMITLLLIGYLLDRKNISLNSLFVAAFIMLVYNPRYLFDVGFQLSFVSVASILLLMPFFDQFLKRRNAISRYWLSVLLMTTVVQLGSFAVAAYYFHTIPLMALPANLLIVPILPLLLFGAILLLAFPHFTILKEGVSGLLSWIEIVIEPINEYAPVTTLPVWIEPEYLLFYFLFLLCVVLFFTFRNGRYMVLILGSVGLFLITHFYLRPIYRPSIQRALVVYNRTDGDFLQVAYRGQNLFIPIDSAVDYKTASYLSENFQLKNQLPSPRVITDSTFSVGDFNYHYPFIEFNKKRILLLNSDEWKESYVADSARLRIDYAILSGNYRGGMKLLDNLFDIQNLVITSGVSPLLNYVYRTQADIRNIHVHNISKEGAWIKIEE